MGVRRVAIIALVGSVLVGGCGGSGSVTPSGTGGAPAPVPTSPAAASPSGSPSDGGANGGGGGATGGPVAPGGDYCELLGPGDFTAAGVTGAGAPKSSPATPGAYCVYSGASGATGGIELDVFLATNEADASAIYQTSSFMDSGLGKAALPEADEVRFLAPAGGSPDYAVIAVRKGLLVFDISFPAGSGAQDALIALARLVLQRGEALTR